MLPNSPKPATPEAQALLRVAERDWITVNLLLQHPEAPLSSVYFHAQQYLEKVIKAVLVSNAVIFRRTHDLSELAELLARRDRVAAAYGSIEAIESICCGDSL
jgi:HEPN domain-containing protein